jgi:aminopeptidase N
MKNLITLLLLSICFGLSAQDSPSQISTVDFKTARVKFEIDTTTTNVEGIIIFELMLLKATDSIFVDAKNLTSFEAKLDEKVVSAINDGNRLVIKNDFKKGSNHKLEIKFNCQPNKALYFIDADNNGVWEQAWTQGQGKYTSNWLPSIDDTNDKMIWEQEITAPEGMSVLANGSLNKLETKAGKTTHKYAMSLPMSSYLVAFVAGEYASYKETSESGVSLEYYFYPDEKGATTFTYQDTREMFNFMEQEIGIAYPWKIYKQVPIKDFLYSGMENTGITIFNDQFLQGQIGSNDQSYITVNAHEMAHQWFGNLVTAATPSDHWLQEGFATYYSMLAERHLYGDNHFQILLYQQAEALLELSNSGNKKALTDAGASSLTFYQHGAWALHALKDEIGEDSFRKSVTTYLQSHAFQNATTDDFLKIASTVSGKDLNSFSKIWLETPAFPTDESLRILRKSLFMEAFFQLAARRLDNFDDAYQSYKETLREPVQKELVKEMIAQLSQRTDPRKYELLIEASKTGNVEIRQLISLSTREVNDGNREMIEDLLMDDSYITRENALYLLWRDATDKKAFLNKTRVGWQQINPSLDIAWFALALSTPTYSNRETINFLAEIRKFTAGNYNTQTRTAAFDYLISLDIMSLRNYQDLMQASQHHVWRFYKNARDLLQSLYKKEESRSMLEQAMLLLDRDSVKVMERILKIK